MKSFTRVDISFSVFMFIPFQHRSFVSVNRCNRNAHDMNMLFGSSSFCYIFIFVLFHFVSFFRFSFISLFSAKQQKSIDRKDAEGNQKQNLFLYALSVVHIFFLFCFAFRSQRCGKRHFTLDKGDIHLFSRQFLFVSLFAYSFSFLFHFWQLTG